MKSFIYSLHSRYFNLSFAIFKLLLVAHFVEHISQMVELYAFHWERTKCLGLIGNIYPWLVTSESYHYIFALITMLGIFLFRRSRIGGKWWEIALWLAFYHHIEHIILLSQAISGQNFCTFRCSLGSFLMPRIELHFFYNLIILIPMGIAINKLSTR
jgi:hypothetical protein